MQQTFYIPVHLLERRIMIQMIGAGGSGSELLDGLVRMDTALRAVGHPGLHITLWDGDTVSATNIVRQRFLPGDEGQNKAAVLIHRLNLFMGTDWQAVPRRFDPARERIDFDLLITCVDKAAVRAAIGKKYNALYSSQDRMWLDLGNDASDGQVILGHIGRVREDTPLRLPNVFDLYPELETNSKALDNEGDSCSAEEALRRQEFPINRQVAVSAYTLLWNLLRHGKLDHHGVFVDVRTGRSTPLMIDSATWEFMGYSSKQQVGQQNH